MKKKDIDWINLISDLEQEIAQECVNRDRYPYPISYNESDEEEEHYFKFGANELYISTGIENVLHNLEKRYGLDFEKLESDRISRMIEVKQEIKNGVFAHSGEKLDDLRSEALRCAECYLEEKKPYFRVNRLPRLLRRNYFSFDEIEYVMLNLDYTKWVSVYSKEIIKKNEIFCKYSDFTMEKLKRDLRECGFEDKIIENNMQCLDYDWSAFLEAYVARLVDETNVLDEEYARVCLERSFNKKYCELGIAEWKKQKNRRVY